MFYNIGQFRESFKTGLTVLTPYVLFPTKTGAYPSYRTPF